MRYYVEQKITIPGPGGEVLNFGTEKKKVDREYIQNAIDAFLSNAPNPDADKIYELNRKVWECIETCKKTVTIGNEIFSAKK